MLHYTEIELLVYSELRNYLDMLNCGIEKVKHLGGVQTINTLLLTVDELLSGVMHNPIVESMVETNINNKSKNSQSSQSQINLNFSGQDFPILISDTPQNKQRQKVSKDTDVEMAEAADAFKDG